MGVGPHSLVNVKFFGQHDRAYVPVKDCYLYSVQDPNTQTGKKSAKELADCIKEVGEHIERIIAKVGGFSYAPYKTPYDPAEEINQLENMMPGVQEFIKRQQATTSKPSLQFKIYKTADNNLSIIQKDLSTGEILNSQQPPLQQEIDELAGGSQKKKKGFTPPPAPGVEDKNVDSVIISAAKYEVISKMSSDDSNSSKLSPVILKRKSTNGNEVKKQHEEESPEQSLPKLARIEDKMPELNNGNQTLKRKMDPVSSEKPKAKHTKPQDLKVPVMAIKTISINKEVNMLIQTVSKPSQESAVGVISVPTTSQSADVVASQNAVESLVKNKQGVTIKKIAKNMATTTVTTATVTSSVSSNLSATMQSQTTPTATNKNNNMVSSSHKTVEKRAGPTTHKDKTDEQKQRDEVNSILKGLKPFVEVKKEVLSDKEEEEPANMANTTTTATTKNKPCEKPTTTGQTASTQKTTCPKEPTGNNKNNLLNENTNSNLLLRVKEEVFSDEEPIDDNAPLLPELSVPNAGQTVKLVGDKNVDNVRLVGDTVIQKLSGKNVTGQQSNTSNVNINKRCSLKGIPYGPLPASAVPKTNMTSTQHDTAAGVTQRAKKSFPQNSPPTDKLTANSVNNNSVVPSLVCGKQGANQNMEGSKRPLSRTTMVAIPVDFAATTPSSISMGTMMSSIPVPPLTAVSKMSSVSACAYNTMPHNTVATVTVSGTSGSLTTPSVVSQNSITTAVTQILSSQANTSLSSISSSLISTPVASTTSSVAARKSPITVVTFNNKSAASTTASQNSKNALRMSTPPPLAGLSGSTLSNSTLSNVPATPETIASATTTATGCQTESSSEAQLLSGLVVPNLATAITDIINRGPPKLAARPRGPLQSEGYPMFASQAGPVSKLFVDNAHKVGRRRTFKFMVLLNLFYFIYFFR